MKIPPGRDRCQRMGSLQRVNRLVGQYADSPGSCDSRGDVRAVPPGAGGPPLAGPGKASGDGLWRRIAFWGLVLLTQVRPASNRWRWVELGVGGEVKSGLVSPSGRVWEFKLKKGAWIRPAKEGVVLK